MNITVSENNSLTDLYINEYLGKVFYFALKRTGNRQEAEDLSSDISLCIIAELQKGRVPQSFSAWVWQIARNRYSRWADSKSKKPLVPLEGDELDLIAAEENTEEALIKAEELKTLRRELAFISTEHRKLVVSYYIENKSLRDIASSLGLKEGAVKMRLSRVRNILKEGMNMAREFGIRSYKPEDIDFSATGEQGSGLPWSAVRRKLPKNILLQADNNPSTVEELAMELGISVPYMEEEVELLEKATLLRKVGNKYVTDFFIFSKESRLEIYNILKERSSERSELINKIANETLPKIRELGVVYNNMTDGEIKWWLCIAIAEFMYLQGESSHSFANPAKRANGETWGFVGYEKCELPENLFMGHNGWGSGWDSDIAWIWCYKLNGLPGMFDRVGEPNDWKQVSLLKDAIKNKRKTDSFTENEKHIWEGINNRFAHADSEGNVIPDILVFRGNTMEKARGIIEAHPLFKTASDILNEAIEKIMKLLRKNSNELLKTQLRYCTLIEVCKTRMSTLCDLVNSGDLVLPEQPEKSTVAIYMEME